MEQIVKVHFPDLKGKLLGEAMKTFYMLREIEDFRKKPSTSELIDWIRVLIAAGVPLDDISNEIPFIGTLLKKETDFYYFTKRYMTRVGDKYMMRKR